MPFWVLGLVVLATAISMAGGHSPNHLFREGAFFTDVSVVLLLACGVICALLLHERVLKRRTSPDRGPAYLVWALVALGFVYLAADECFELHENVLEPLVVRWAGLKENALTDRIDDLIVASYGVVCIAGMVLCWREFFIFRSAWKQVALAFALGAASAALDVLTNDDSIFREMGLSQRTTRTTMRWLEAGEDTCKLMAEACMLAALGFALSLAHRIRMQGPALRLHEKRTSDLISTHADR